VIIDKEDSFHHSLLRLEATQGLIGSSGDRSIGPSEDGSNFCVDDPMDR